MTVHNAQTKSVTLPINRLALVSITCAAIGVVGLVLVGMTALEVFAVGSGHVALQQIKARHERGATLAYIALGVSYLTATLALFGAIYLEVGLGLQ
jgi:hypothetical protein